jgi:hypothetical protein
LRGGDRREGGLDIPPRVDGVRPGKEIQRVLPKSHAAVLETYRFDFAFVATKQSILFGDANDANHVGTLRKMLCRNHLGFADEMHFRERVRLTAVGVDLGRDVRVARGLSEDVPNLRTVG